MVRNNTVIINVSVISLTNGKYNAWNGIVSDKSIDKIQMDINSLGIWKHTFYDGRRKKIKIGQFYEYPDIIQRCRKTQDFQQVLDIIYLHCMKEKGNGILT